MGIRSGLSRKMDYVPSATSIAIYNGLFGLTNFTITYVFPEQQINSLWTIKKPSDMKLAKYLTTFVGQHSVPWTVMSLITAYTGNATKEYMLASTIFQAFLTYDIAVRVSGCCEEMGIPKDKIVGYVPVVAVAGILSFLRWQQM